MFFKRFRAIARHGLAALALATAALAAPVAAEARSITIGSEEVLRQLQDIRLQGPQGEPLYLGHKVTFHWLGLPYSVSDDGYVIGVKGKSLYYKVSGEQISGWQRDGYLPSPLPTYQLGLVDYILGYLLWIALALVSLWWLVRKHMTRTRPVAAAVAPEATAPSQEAQRRVMQAVRSEPSLPCRNPDNAAAPLANTAGFAPRHPEPPTSLPQPQQARTSPVRHNPAPLGDVTPLPGSRPPQPIPLPHAPQVTRLPVAKTRCRVKALKQAC